MHNSCASTTYKNYFFQLISVSVTVYIDLEEPILYSCRCMSEGWPRVICVIPGVRLVFPGPTLVSKTGPFFFLPLVSNKVGRSYLLLPVRLSFVSLALRISCLTFLHSISPSLNPCLLFDLILSTRLLSASFTGWSASVTVPPQACLFPLFHIRRHPNLPLRHYSLLHRYSLQSQLRSTWVLHHRPEAF